MDTHPPGGSKLRLGSDRLAGYGTSKGLLSLDLNLSSQDSKTLNMSCAPSPHPNILCPALKSPFHPAPIYLAWLSASEAPWLFSGSVTFNSSLTPIDCSPSGSSGPWDSPGQNTGLACHALLQGIVLTQGSSPYLLHWQVDSLPLSHQGSPVKHSCCCCC